MKKNTIHPIRQVSNRFGIWLHRIIERKGEHIEACGWYPGPMSN